MTTENCPMCQNHCPKENLRCGRGREYFNENKHQEDYNNTSEHSSIKEQVIFDMRRCGHFLHHNRELDINKVFSNLSDEELTKLHELLTNIHNNME